VKNYLRSVVTSLLILVSVFAVSLSSTVPAVLAASNSSGNGFRISPPRYELTIKPGQTETVSLFVENLANSRVTAHPVVNDFTASPDENGEPQLILDPNKSAPTNSFKPLVEPIPDTSIAALERKEVKVTLHVPANATPGGYYGAIRFTPVYSNSGPANVSLTASVGTLFLITVPGNLTEKLTVASFDATKNGKAATFFNSGPITLVTRLNNQGNIHVQPFGKIVIKNTFGKIVYETELNDSDPRGNVLPGSIRKFENPISLKHMFGKYTAVGNFAYGSNGKIISVQKTFYVIPYVLIIIILLILAFLIFGLPRLIRAYNRRVIEKAQQRFHQ
jgi:hypothetical protein